MTHENMPTHVRNCLEAIDSIGGDPATVAELVAALRAICETGAISARLLYNGRSVLAKLPKVK